MSCKAIVALAFIALLSACAVAPEGSAPPQFSGTIDQSAPPIIIDGRGGGSIAQGREYVNRMMARAFSEGRPVRLSGRFTSAGTFALFLVENVPGSCAEANTIFGFHRAVAGVSILTVMPIPLTGSAGDIANANIAETYNPALARWFLDGIESGLITTLFTNLRGSEMAQFGYPVCEEEQ